MTKKEVPYGAWVSPITSNAITAGSIRLSDIYVHRDTLYWLEGRPQEAGRIVLCRQGCSDEEASVVDVSPSDANVRTRVHEYGGGAVTFGGDHVYYTDFQSQRVFKQHLGHAPSAAPQPLTPEGGRYRFADGVYDHKSNRLFIVREDHKEDAPPEEVVNEIVTVDVDSGAMRVVATGNDFYAAPRLSPDGTKLAYITWNHPNMPWDSTKLYVTTFDAASETQHHTLVAGGDDDTSVMQPLWQPQTGQLFYISDQSGFWNVYRQDTPTSILPKAVDFGESAPGWTLGSQGYRFLADGRMVASFTEEGVGRLVIADVSGPDVARNVCEYGGNSDGLPPMLSHVVAATSGDELYMVGGSPSTPTGIHRWSPTTKAPATLVRSSSSLSFPAGIISTPQQLRFPSTAGAAYAYYYPPTNDVYECTTESAPPLLVKAHGGPTACAGIGFNPLIQFWTSRGFAVADVDYGGSTGYGREYRRRLRGQWGIVDIDDVSACAQYLVEQGLADKHRLCIDGGSAGGYTTLGALAFRNIFTAGCSLYGVGDLTALAKDTHKFESRYLDGLVGRYPEDEQIYKDRSPIESVDSLSCPILLLQGDEDKIVPPNQAEMMHAALKNKGIKTALKMYKGEQHGFRKAENIEDALNSELSFYRQVYGIQAPAGETTTLEIDNF